MAALRFGYNPTERQSFPCASGVAARPAGRGPHWTKAGAWAFLPPPVWAGQEQEENLPQSLDEVRYEIALANRMLANEGVLDAFGHVSMRHPDDPGRYLLSRSRGPELVEPDDVLEFNMD